MRLSNKVAVVLGASAEGGTGWTTAETLAREGAKVVVGARKIEPLKVLADKIGGLAVACDAGNEDQVRALSEAAVKAYGPLDIAINSAARPILSTIAEASLKGVQRSLDVNYIGQVYFIKHMADAMRDGGSILLISSSSAAQPLMPFFPYACAKAATDCLVRYAALEYGPRGIRVISILPGPIKTPLAEHIFGVPGTEAVYEREIPLGRVALPIDIAEAAVWLSGTHYISGVNLPVSGGMHLTRSPRDSELPAGTTARGDTPRT